ncbi:MAG: hypothetical protein QOK17_3036 [Sphingomonadales bacterium]|jgi:hypothetical protein|nr:hypothetical protein [Sphingomonadales bacterium]
MRKSSLWLSAAVASLALAAPAAAWNGRGHMMVAAAAWQRLDQPARDRVGDLLEISPFYASWTAGVPAGASDEEKHRVAFLRAATFPDDIKSAPSYVNDHATGAEARRNIGYKDCDQHRYWHFKDLPFSTDGTALEPPGDPNAETQIKTFAALLADPGADNALKSYDLAWLAHLVGDVHQPLHATSRFSAGLPHGDQGGNKVKVCDPGCGKGLHGVWDDALGNSTDPASVIAAAAALPAADSHAAAALDPDVWLAESLVLARSDVYRTPVGNGAGPFTLNAAYDSNRADTARERVALAGARLAALIEAAHLQIASSTPPFEACGQGTVTPPAPKHAGGVASHPPKPKQKHKPGKPRHHRRHR